MRQIGNALSLRQYGPSPGSHAHDHFQVLLGMEGELELEVQGRGRRIAAGDGCVIAPGARHDFEARAGARCLVLDTTQAAWADCPTGPAQSTAALALAGYLRLALAQHNSLALQYGPLLLLDCWRVPVLAPTHSRRHIDWDALGRWGQLHLHEPLTVADLAQQVFLSPTQFAARCRRETGMSAIQWLRDLRLARARALRTTGLSVGAVAHRCGYQSASALAAAMRRHGSQT